MTFEVGRLSAALTLDGVDQFHRELDGVGRKLDEAGQRGSSFGRLGEAAVRQVAGATTGLVGAAGAYLAILTKTGVAYNSLQQNSRAALKVLLGGTEQANAQMDKLDAFAKNSPFSKSVFIQAQQQLIGFGMQAKKVIPTLDAVQQAVAAMGGSNEQITEVVGILAKVQSTGKFTAETLNELGYRGVDAATLMGNAMGKSAAKIREDISKGAIGGAKAIDVLVGAMQDRFGGAADGVKEQWTGATDRIKAASRDLGSHIAEPFVSAQGGGMAVTWANQVANVLRAIEKQSVPVMEILTQRGMPLFAGISRDLDAAQASIQRWNPEALNKSLDEMSAHAPGVAALAGAVLALGAQVGPLGRMFSVLGISANPVLAAFVGLAAASPELRSALMGLLESGKPLLPVIGELATILSGSLNSALPLVAGGVELLTSVLRPVVSLIEQIPAPVLVGVAAFLAMHKASEQLLGPLEGVGTALLQFGQRAAVQAALGETSRGMGMLSVASMSARGAVLGVGNALKTAFLSNPVGVALTLATTVVGAWAMANAAAEQKVEEHRQRVAALKDTLNETTGAITAASAANIEESLANGQANDLLQKIGVTRAEATKAILEGGASYDQLTSKIQASTASSAKHYRVLSDGQKLRTLSIAEARSLTEAIEAESDAVRGSIEDHRAEAAAVRETAAAMSDAGRSNERFNDALQVARDITQDAETRVRALKQALDELKGGAISAEEAEKRLSETNLTLAEGLAQADEKGKALWKSTLNRSGEIDKESRAGLAFADAMGRSRDAMLDAARAASDQALANGDVAGAVEAAQSAGEGYISTLRKTMREAGLTKSQIRGLIDEYLDVPAVVATLLTDEGTISEIDQQALALAMRLDSVPEGKSIKIDNPGGKELVERLRDLGFKVKELPDGRIKITQTGAEAVESILQNLTAPRNVFINAIYRGVKAQGPTPDATFGSANGNLFNQGVPQAFANGGFPTGFYPGGPPLYKFAEPETVWEAFISGRKGQEERNAKIAMEALQRLGFPVIPVSALRGVPEFANGGFPSSTPPVSMPSAPVQIPRRRRSSGKIADVIQIGVDTPTSELRKLADMVRYRRED